MRGGITISAIMLILTIHQQIKHNNCKNYIIITACERCETVGGNTVSVKMLVYNI